MFRPEVRSLLRILSREGAPISFLLSSWNPFTGGGSAGCRQFFISCRQGSQRHHCLGPAPSPGCGALAIPRVSEAFPYQVRADDLVSLSHGAQHCSLAPKGPGSARRRRPNAQVVQSSSSGLGSAVDQKEVPAGHRDVCEVGVVFHHRALTPARRLAAPLVLDRRNLTLAVLAHPGTYAHIYDPERRRRPSMRPKLFCCWISVMPTLPFLVLPPAWMSVSPTDNSPSAGSQPLRPSSLLVLVAIAARCRHQAAGPHDHPLSEVSAGTHPGDLHGRASNLSSSHESKSGSTLPEPDGTGHRLDDVAPAGIAIRWAKGSRSPYRIQCREGWAPARGLRPRFTHCCGSACTATMPASRPGCRHEVTLRWLCARTT